MAGHYLQKLKMNAGILQLASSTAPEQMNYPDRQTLLDLEVVTPSTFGPWFMEPFGGGLVAASREFSPIPPTQQITAYCRSEAGEPVLMLTSDYSLKNVKAFLEPYARPKDAKISNHPGMLTLDGVSHEITSTAISVASTGDLVFIRMAISKSIARSITTTKDFTLTYDAPQYEGYHSGSTTLSDKDRKSIALAFRNCV